MGELTDMMGAGHPMVEWARKFERVPGETDGEKLVHIRQRWGPSDFTVTRPIVNLSDHPVTFHMSEVTYQRVGSNGVLVGGDD